MIELGTLSKVDPERNSALMAAALGWPDGAVEECRAVEAEEPSYHVCFAIGGVASQPEPGFVARRRDDMDSSQEPLYAPTAGELLRAIRRARPNPPPNAFIPPLYAFIAPLYG